MTPDVYGHLIPAAETRYVDRLDELPEEGAKKQKNTAQESAPPAHLREFAETELPSDVVDLFGGGGWTRTSDLRIMRPSL